MGTAGIGECTERQQWRNRCKLMHHLRFLEEMPPHLRIVGGRHEWNYFERGRDALAVAEGIGLRSSPEDFPASIAKLLGLECDTVTRIFKEAHFAHHVDPWDVTPGMIAHDILAAHRKLAAEAKRTVDEPNAEPPAPRI